MSLKTQNQERAKFVIDKLEELKKSSYCDKLSAFILTNGLLPTLAFLQSKTDKLYNVIEEYLKQKFKTGDKNIIEALADSNSSILRLATKEVMELSNWIRRLVKSES